MLAEKRKRAASYKILRIDFRHSITPPHLDVACIVF